MDQTTLDGHAMVSQAMAAKAEQTAARARHAEEAKAEQLRVAQRKRIDREAQALRARAANAEPDLFVTPESQSKSPRMATPFLSTDRAIPLVDRKPNQARLIAIAAAIAALGGSGAWWATRNGGKRLPDAASAPRATLPAVARPGFAAVLPALRSASAALVIESAAPLAPTPVASPETG